jgi:hypothetical protein
MVIVDIVETFCWKQQQQLRLNVGEEQLRGTSRNQNFVDFLEVASDERNADKPMVQIGLTMNRTWTKRKKLNPLGPSEERTPIRQQQQLTSLDLEDSTIFEGCYRMEISSIP